MWNNQKQQKFVFLYVKLTTFFDQYLNKRLSKQSVVVVVVVVGEGVWGWWFETPSGPLLRHCNEGQTNHVY